MPADVVDIGGDEVGILQQQRHLGDGEGANGLDADGDVEHLTRDQLPVPSPFQPRQLDQDRHVPGIEERYCGWMVDVGCCWLLGVGWLWVG